MYYLAIRNDNGELLELSRSKDYSVQNIEGLAETQAQITMTQTSNIDGALVIQKRTGSRVFDSVRVNVRQLVFSIVLHGNIERSRQRLYKFFNVKKMVRVFFKNQNRNVYIEGYVENLEVPLFGNPQTAHVVLLCPSPFFRDVNAINTEFSLIKPRFTFPFSNPVGKRTLVFSEIGQDTRQTILNSGDVDTGVTIRALFKGDGVKNIVIYNTETAGAFRVTFDFMIGDVLFIDTNIGKKSVYLYRGAERLNLINYVGRNPDWFVLALGANHFAIDSDSGTEFIVLTMRHEDLYVGV